MGPPARRAAPQDTNLPPLRQEARSGCPYARCTLDLRSLAASLACPILGACPDTQEDTGTREPGSPYCRGLLTAQPPARSAALAWSTWRRRHQHRAKVSHYQRRQANYNEVRLEY